MQPLLPALLWPHALPLGAVILDAVGPLRYPSHLVAHDATDGNNSLPPCFALLKGVPVPEHRCWGPGSARAAAC